MWNAKTESDERIIINESIKPLLPSWLENPSTFLHYSPKNTQFNGDLPARFYLTLKRLNESRVVDLVRWRFYLLGFYELKKTFGRQQLRANSGDEFANLIIESELEIDNTQDDVKQNCASWANAGGRYGKIAEELGGKGILILLPEDIHRNM
jgi:hypothetical protein